QSREQGCELAHPTIPFILACYSARSARQKPDSDANGKGGACRAARMPRKASIAMAQSWSADVYAEHAPFVPELGRDVLALLAPRAGERILDLGCGDGALSARIAEAGAQLVAVDSSDVLLAAARARGLDARLMDAQSLTFAGEFDAVFSNAALHWM